MKQFAKKGFTLIELMIVIVILGVLMSTVLPKLTGAQGRARDTARMADLGNLSSALQVYMDDNGQYPGAVGTSECLTSGGVTGTAIKAYLKGSNIMTDPLKTNAVGATPTCSNGQYYYVPTAKNNVAKSSYILCANTETYQKANTDFAAFLIALGAGNTEALTSAAIATIGLTNLVAETANANDSVYCVSSN